MQFKNDKKPLKCEEGARSIDSGGNSSCESKDYCDRDGKVKHEETNVDDDETIKWDSLAVPKAAVPRPFSCRHQTKSPKPVPYYPKPGYLCDWYPQLFGVDEDVMPSSEEDEGLFELEKNDDDLEEKAKYLTKSQLSSFRIGSMKNLTDDELRAAWMRYHVPRYGRRARAKPRLKPENKASFECICDIDRRFSRHHIPHFRKGELQEGEELRVPHFKAFWEDFRDKEEEEDEDWGKILETKPDEKIVPQKGLLYRPVPKFEGSSRNEMKTYRKQLLASFRPLTCREIRRYRMPFTEALYLELQEDRFFETAQLFKYLIIKDYYAHKNPLSSGPTLRQSKTKALKLIMYLKLAEKISRRGEYHREANVLLRCGKYFNDHDQNWWWLAEELYTKAVNVSQKSVIDGGKSEAICRYILGTFLLDYVYRVQPAQEHLLKARELSMGKDWSAGKILNKRQEPIFMECSNDLSRALIAASRELRKHEKPEEALPLIHRSYKLCQEIRTTRRDIEMQTYFELGMTYQALAMFDWAKTSFRKFIEIAKLENLPKSVCDGYLQMAICFRGEGDLPRCHHSLLNYAETAEKSMDENLMAFGFRYLGEYHLNNGDANLAIEFFEKAFYLFLQQYEESRGTPVSDLGPESLSLPHDVELTRVLAGLAEGELLTKPICQLILQSRDGKNPKETEKLMKWKNCRERHFEFEGSKFEESTLVEGDNTNFVLGIITKPSESDSDTENAERMVRFAEKK